MAAADQWSVDVLDSILTEFGGAARPPKSKGVKAHKPLKDGRRLLAILFGRLFPDDLQDQFTTLLGALAGESFDSVEQNRQVVDRLNRILRGTELTLVSQQGTPVRLRLIKPARSANGYFQLRTADAHQKSVYSGAKFPQLRIELDV